MGSGIQTIPLSEIEDIVTSNKVLPLPIQFIKELSFVDNQLNLLDVVSKWAYKIFDVERVSIAVILPGRRHFMVYALTMMDPIV